jgi:hypothetical protein
MADASQARRLDSASKLARAAFLAYARTRHLVSMVSFNKRVNYETELKDVPTQ